MKFKIASGRCRNCKKWRTLYGESRLCEDCHTDIALKKLVKPRLGFRRCRVCKRLRVVFGQSRICADCHMAIGVKKLRHRITRRRRNK